MNRARLRPMLNNHPDRRSNRHPLCWLVLVLLLAPLLPARSAPAAPMEHPAVQTSGAAPQFLRDIPDLRGLIEDADTWAVGGGFLYWAHCVPDGPRLNGIGPAATGYLRRWPLRGGRVATLSDAATCTGDSMAADETGLYYYDDIAGSIIYRAVSDPFTPRTVTSSQGTTGPIVLASDYLFWLENNYIRAVNKNDFSVVYLRSAGVGARSLMLDGDGQLWWFGDSLLYKMPASCLFIYIGGCRETVASENGDYLINAEQTGPLPGSSVSPLWVNGSNIRGIWCRFESGGPFVRTCSPSTSYTAPTVNGNAYRPGRLATDGTYLFWVENYAEPYNCSPPFGCSYRPSANGRLMKWNLNQSFFVRNPFDTPQPIACLNCYASYSINTYGEQIAVADGWVYFETSNGISRIRADAPPIAWDLAVDSWEVTQAIQSPANDVPLIANKPTYVRLYGRKLSGPSVFGVEARLYGRTAAGTPLPGSPLAPINGTQGFTTDNTPPNRADSNGGWLFQLPEEWTSAGGIQLSPQIDPRGVWNDPNRANNALTYQSLNFIAKPPICIVFIPVRTDPRVQMFTPAHWFAIDMVKRLLPTPDVWVFHQDEDVAELQARLGIPPWEYGPYEVEEDSDKILRSLWWREQLTDDPDRCDDVHAITHYVGVVNPNAGGPNGTGFIGDHILWFRLPPDNLSRDWQTDRAATLAHELGHNYGRNHVDCPPGVPDGPDPSYPYPTCQLDQDDGVSRHYGFTFNPFSSAFEVIGPTRAGDVMSYENPRWISDFTWRAILNALPNPAAAQAARAELPNLQQHTPNLAAAASVVIVSGAVDTANAANSALDYAWVFPTSAVSQGMVRKWQRNAAPTVGSRTLAAGNYHLRLLDAGGSVLDDRAITLDDPMDDSGPMHPFLITFPAPSAQVARIELLDGDVVLAQLQPGAQAPTLSLITPAGGETFDTQMTISWRASDPDSNDRLLFTVQYSPDNGQTWRVLLSDFPNLSGTDTVTVDLRNLSGIPASTSGGRIRVLASDGYNTAMVLSQPFTVPNRAPQPTISMPWPGQSIPAGQPVLLQGAASDAEDGGLSGAALRWTVDGQDAGAGQTRLIAGLAPGQHTVTLTARDSAGREQSTSTTLTVEALRIPQGSTPTLDGECSDAAYAGAVQVQLAPQPGGGQPTVHLLRTAEHLWACFSNMPRAGGTSPGSLAVVRVDTDYSRDPQPQPGDFMFVLGEDGVPKTYQGSGGSYNTLVPGGLAGQVSANQTMWQAELRIDASVLGGWNRVVGLDVTHAWVNAPGDDYHWPYNAIWDNPSTWATTVLGDVPQLTAVAPESATAGGVGFTLTVSGTGFLEGATVRWNGVDKPTTFVSSTELRASIAASDIASAGTVAITVVNPGMGAVPSNALPFFIGGAAPGDGARRVFLPLIRR